MRYFIELAYNGTNYSGWQRQPNAPSVQQTIEDALSLMTGQEIKLIGCGRTDARVHASFYVAHADIEGTLPEHLLERLNKYLPADIVIKSIYPAAEKHARFDATYRAYEYYLSFEKPVFQQDTVYYYPYPQRPTLEQLNKAASIISEFSEFFPFCKSNHDAKTMICTIFRSEWVLHENGRDYIYHIAANRFLRGMVRLIVGMCINVALGKVELNEVRKALEEQTRLKKDNSAPASGLYLSEIKY